MDVTIQFLTGNKRLLGSVSDLDAEAEAGLAKHTLLSNSTLKRSTTVADNILLIVSLCSPTVHRGHTASSRAVCRSISILGCCDRLGFSCFEAVYMRLHGTDEVCASCAITQYAADALFDPSCAGFHG